MQLLPIDGSQGTGFLVSPTKLVTALHVVVELNDAGDILLDESGLPTSLGEVTCKYFLDEEDHWLDEVVNFDPKTDPHDIDQDWAVLTVSNAPSNAVWDCGVLGDDQHGVDCWTYGFPTTLGGVGAQAQGKVVGCQDPYPQNGTTIRLHRARFEEFQGATGVSPQGFSGGPIVVREVVVGLVRMVTDAGSRLPPESSDPKVLQVVLAEGGVVFVVPIEAVLHATGVATARELPRPIDEGGAPMSPDETVANAFKQAREARIAELKILRAQTVAAGADPQPIADELLEQRRQLRDGPATQPEELLGGRYYLLAPAGDGGFATVWRAIDQENGTVVAVKILHGRWMRDHNRVERFMRGAHRMATLRHPGIVPALSEPRNELGRCYYAMEWCPGGDVRQARLNGHIDRDQTLAAVAQAIEGLAFAHAKEVIHRDVTPANILLDDTGRGRLSDFDLAHVKGSTRGTKTGMGMGKFAYAAPEQQKDASKVDARADIYGAGLCVVFALLGRDPPAFVAALEPHVLDELACRSALREVVRGAIAYKADERTTSCLELVAAIHDELNPSLAPDPSPREPEPPPFLARGPIAWMSSLGSTEAKIKTGTSKLGSARGATRPDSGWMPADSNRWDWGRLGAIATIIGVLISVGALVTSWFDGSRFDDDDGETSQEVPLEENDLYTTSNKAAVLARATATTDPRTAALIAASALHSVAGTPAVAGSDPEIALRIGLSLTRGHSLVDELNPGGAVSAVAISPTGDKAIATSGWVAKVWDITSGNTTPVVLRGHQGQIEIAEVTPDGRWLVTAAEDRTVRLWNLQADRLGTDIRVLRSHEGKVDALDFSADGRWMISSSSETGHPRIWDLHSADPTNPVGSISGDGGTITDVAIAADGSAAYTSSDDMSVKIWALDKGRASQRFELIGHEARVLSIDVSNDGRWLVSASQDRTARMWDLNSVAPGSNPTVLLGHKDSVTKVVITPDSKLAVTASDDTTLRIWELDAKDPLAEAITFRGHTRGINDLRVDSSSSWAVTAGKDAKVIAWNLAKRAVVVENIEFPGHSRDTKALALSADGRWLISGSVDGNAYVWDYRGKDSSNGNYFVARSHTGRVLDVDVSRDGKRFVSVGSDAQAVLWEFEGSGRPYARDMLVSHEQAINVVALAPGGRYAATAGRDQSILVWDFTTDNPSEPVKRLEGHEGEVMDLAFTSDGARLISCSTDKSVRVWTAAAAWAGTEFVGHHDEVVRLAISPKDDFLVSADIGGVMMAWELNPTFGAKQAFKPHERAIWTLVFSEDGKWLVSGSADHNALLWPVGFEGLEHEPVFLSGHTDTINSASFSSDGRWLATGSKDGTVRLWDLSSDHPEEDARSLEMLNLGGVEWVQFGPDAERLYTGNDDGSVHIWYPDPVPGRGDHQILLGHEKKVSALAMPVDGSFLLTGSYDGTARVWPMTPPGMIKLGCYAAGRSPSKQEWQEWLPGQPYKAICD